MPFSHGTKFSRLTDEQHMLVGMFVVEWASAEFYLGELLCRLLGGPEFLSRTFTDSLGAAQLQDAIRQAVEIHTHRYRGRLIESEKLDEIVSVNQGIEAMRGLRNKFAHFCWMRSHDGEIFGTSLSGSVPQGKKFKRGQITLEIGEIRRQYDALFDLVERLQNIVQALPKVEEDVIVAAFKRGSAQE